MADPYYTLRFNMIIRDLEHDDPTFTRRLRGLPGDPDDSGADRRRWRWAWLLWALAPIVIILGGWTGVLLAVIGAIAGLLLVRQPGTLFRRPPG